MSVQVIWDMEDEPKGNFRHIMDGHDVTVEEVEEILLNRKNSTVPSRTSGNPVTFGWTSTGRYLAVVWEHVQDDPLTIYPLTAYETNPPRKEQS